MASNGYSSNTVNTINGIKDEVLAQITKAQRIINSFQEVSNQDGINVAIIDPNDIKKWQEVLLAEHNKVKLLQHTLAFTGAMNAGNSMILNAIIGARILPNRDTPMTSLPTVITHKPKQTQPILYISDVESYNEAIVQINQKWSAIEKSKSQSQFSITSELEETLNKLQTIDSILNEYCGENEVYNALFIMSDIIRICTKFSLYNPLEKYEFIEQFPRIEIEFSSLKHIEDNPGVLSLIDSPGFNEFGQSKLCEIIEKVLRDSSATVCVIDYTQLKGKDEQDIKKSVQNTQDYAKSKLFVLINKFDQNTAQGLDENGVKKYVIEQLFPERKIENETLSVKDKVFPVSGKSAFFGNMAIQAMTNQGKLPLPEKESWVRDFAKLAYVTSSGVEKELNNLSSETHRKNGDNLWADSKIEQPLGLIVEASLKEAAPESLRIALRKVQEIIEQLNQSIIVFNNGLNKDENKLKEILARLSSRLSQIPNTERELLSYTKKQMKDISPFLDILIPKLVDKVITDFAIPDLLEWKEGKYDTTKDLQQQIKQQVSDWLQTDEGIELIVAVGNEWWSYTGVNQKFAQVVDPLCREHDVPAGLMSLNIPFRSESFFNPDIPVPIPLELLIRFIGYIIFWVIMCALPLGGPIIAAGITWFFKDRVDNFIDENIRKVNLPKRIRATVDNAKIYSLAEKRDEIVTKARQAIDSDDEAMKSITSQLLNHLRTQVEKKADEASRFIQ